MPNNIEEENKLLSSKTIESKNFISLLNIIETSYKKIIKITQFTFL